MRVSLTRVPPSPLIGDQPPLVVHHVEQFWSDDTRRYFRKRDSANLLIDFDASAALYHVEIEAETPA